MKLVTIRTNLKEGVFVVEKASNNSGLPILKNALVEAKDNRIRLVTTNLEIAITYFVSGKIIEEGQITVPISILSDLVNNLQNERLSLESRESNLEIKTDNYQALIQGQPVKDFPIIPKIKDEVDYLEISSETFKEALEETIIASQFSEIRPELSCVLFNFSLDNLKLTATDSFRLAEKTLVSGQIRTNHQEGFRFLVPLKTCQDVLRVLKTGSELKIYHDENQVLFKAEQLEFISRLLEGNFPNYDYLIPKKFNSELIVDRQEFMNALRLSGVFSTKVSEVKIRTSDNKKLLEISSAEQGLGENRYFLPAKITGESAEISFNWRYLSDGLKALKTKEALLGLSEENKPALLRGVGDTSCFYILMPVIKT